MKKKLFAIFASAVTLSSCFVYSILKPLNCDVAWGLTMSEKLLGGHRLYVDLLETNPPMTTWLYLPAVLLSRLTGLSGDGLQILLTFLFVVACLVLSWRILAHAGFQRLATMYCLAAAVSLTLPWLATISEREHWALAALTPMMAIQIVYSASRNASLRQRTISGALAGFAVAIKPVFVLCAVAPALYAAWRRRSLLSLFRREHWIAVGVNVAYLLAVYGGYPAYRTQMLPSLLDTYVRVRAPIPSLASPDLMLGLLAVIALVISRGRRLLGSPVEMISLLTGLGFVFAYVIQGKGFLNHATPICSLVLMSVSLSVLLKPSRVVGITSISARSFATAASILLVGAVLIIQMRAATSPTLYPSLAFVEPIRRLSPAPRMLSISGDLSAGHPLARQVHGQWVSMNGHQWLAASAALIGQRPGVDPSTRRRMQNWIRLDLERLTRDVIINRPDVIVLDDNLFGEGALSRFAPKLAVALSAYERAGQSGSLQLLIIRRDLTAPPQ